MEIGSVATQALQSTLSEVGAGGVPTKTPDEASPEAVAALEQAVQGAPPVDVQPPSGETLSDAPVAPADGADRATLGDRILKGLGQMNQDAQATIDQVQALGAKGADMSAAELVQAQMALAQMSIQTDLTGKLVGKATQTIETFVNKQ